MRKHSFGIKTIYKLELVYDKYVSTTRPFFVIEIILKSPKQRETSPVNKNKLSSYFVCMTGRYAGI